MGNKQKTNKLNRLKKIFSRKRRKNILLISFKLKFVLFGFFSLCLLPFKSTFEVFEAYNLHFESMQCRLLIKLLLLLKLRLNRYWRFYIYLVINLISNFFFSTTNSLYPFKPFVLCNTQLYSRKPTSKNLFKQKIYYKTSIKIFFAGF